MTRKILRAFCGGLLLALTACAVQPEKPKVAIPFDPAEKGPPSHIIDTANSAASIRVYSAGAMSRLGHNHIVLTRDIHGEAWLGDTPEAAAFHLLLPVASFIVDPAELRAQAGPDFAGQPSPGDVAGTRGNMLGGKVLAAEQYPELEIWSERIRGSGEKLTADIIIAARGQLSRVSIPVQTGAGGATLVRGKFTLKQTAIGITPFSILMGAIAVRDELEIEYTLALNLR